MSTPIVASPIYVGVTENLRTRLKSHINDLFRLTEVVEKAPDNKRKEILDAERSFASRAITMGFNEDTVVAWTMNLSSMFRSVADDELRAVAGSAEWLLNRWHKPLLGKR